MRYLLRYFTTLFIALFTILLVTNKSSAQVTTASIEGKITDENGEPLAGANVLAVHLPSGTKRGVSTGSNGGFRLTNLRIGGPYKITATFVGFKKEVQKGFDLTLGKTQTVNFTLSENIESLDELVVTAGTEDINDSRTGAATTIDKEEIDNLPTITRSEEDIYRLSPSSDGNSFAGRNDQFNNFSLDGSIFNNPFGLDVSTAGGQTNAQPISLDAIDQIQVSIAPYDVTQSGFTGASVNAVTKSGTNNIEGTVFGYYRNEQFTGSKVEGQDIFVPDLSQFQTGFSIGGPIVKNKLFFFANFELDLRSDLASNFLANKPGRSGTNVSRVTSSDLDMVSNLLKSKYGYETGSYEQFSHDTDNNKGILKLDWNINNQHSLTLTYNYLDASRDLTANPLAIGRRGPDQTTLQFANSGYEIKNKIQSGILELRSMLGNNYSNKLQIGYTHFDDKRDPFSSPFPTVNIAKNGIRYIVAGHEPFSIHNRLDQKVYQVTDDFDIFANDHTITIGSSFEAFSFSNSFNLGSYFVGQPGGVFAGAGIPISNFQNVINSGQLDAAVQNARDTYKKNNKNDSWDLAEMNVGQWALYAQDEWKINERLNFTYGLRAELPFYFNTKEKIEENIARKGGTVAEGGTYAPNTTYYDENGDPVKLDSKKLPDQKPLFSPRLGFNWDVLGNQELQLRGGSGFFAGRLPFVWIENQVANTGQGLYQVTDPDFEFPQVWRTNLGIEKRFGDGFLLSTDFIYTKDLNGILVRNYGLKKPTGNLTGADNRKYYKSSDKAANNAFVFTNTDKGRSFNWTIEAKKSFADGLFVSLAYNYLMSKDLNSIEAEISSDAFNRNPALGNVNNPGLAPSLYGNKHRFVGNANKTFTYGDGQWQTNLSLFFEFVKGGRFSYTYSGDANGDGSGLNDLIYVPTKAELQNYKFDPGTGISPQKQRQAYNEFILQDGYLRDRRGEYAEKYAVLSPWFSRFDLRASQTLNLGKNSLEFSVDMLNVGNLINSNWGVQQNPTNSQPIGIKVSDPNSKPVYNFDGNLRNTYTNTFDLESRWRIQFGLRYSFN